MGMTLRVLLGSLLITWALGGCLFTPRDPEDPGNGGTGVVWVDPEVLYDALGNMERALEAKALTNYGASFASGLLEMVLDPGDEADLGEDQFPDWTKDKEEERMRGILTSTDATLDVEWFFTPGVSDSIDESASERYYKDLGYRLTFEEGSKTSVYSGFADLWFQDDGTGLWYVSKWIDKRDDTGNLTWGWLRVQKVVTWE
ncbi:MAG: hypothetical protein KAY24_14785 [Candidatus Eisenbacteria sp.]|nr:hypothetical protein [Candidatus Eisenbacteria bacterium]